MHRHLLRVGLLAGLGVVSLSGCAVDSEAKEAAISELDSGLASRISAVTAQIEQAARGHAYVATEYYRDDELPRGLPHTLSTAGGSSGPRRAALFACVVYGGGNGGDEQYIDTATRHQLAERLSSAIGDAPVYRFDSLGIGDVGDDFTARCTVGVRVGTNDILMLQGHGRDSIL